MNEHKTSHKHNAPARTYSLEYSFRWTRWIPTPGNVLLTLFTIAFLILTQNVWARPAQETTTVSSNAPGPNATTMSWQGRLTDEQGNTLNNNVNLIFALFDVPTGGSPVWGPESHNGLPVSDGVFNVSLGSQTPGGIPADLLNSDLYLEIAVNGETLNPREPMRSVPIAQTALTIPDGLANGFWHLIGTTDVATNSIVPVLIPEMSLDIQTVGKPIEINFDTGFAFQTGNSGDGYGSFGIYIDDVLQTQHAQRVYQTNETVNVHLMWVVDGIPPGNHNIAVKWGVSSAGITAIIRSEANLWEQRVLSVHEYRK